MPENILVVEYEPRYTDRVRQALAGQPFVTAFARDGEEAMRALDGNSPKLIVLSSVVPKISTAELIRAIRGRKPLQDTPILLTVSGYTGKSPKLDAQRLGASDILPKPYSESEFLGKVQQMLGVRADATGKTWAPELDPEFAVRNTPSPGVSEGQLTSNEIFGDLLDDERPASTGAKKTMKPKDDLDKMLADTLAGVMPAGRKKEAAPAAAATQAETQSVPKPAPAPPPPPPAAPKPPAEAKPSKQADFDKLLNDTLSGLNPRPRTQPGSVPVPQPAAAPKPAPAPQTPQAAAKPATGARPAFTTEKLSAVVTEKPVAQPSGKTAADEEEPKDGTKFGQYVLLEKIATGGMAEVWKARMRGVEGFQKIVAIKKILPHLSDNQDFIEMFIDEAKLAAQLNHNNIIHIYDLGKIQSSYYIAMEYIDGYDLKTILRRGEERGQPMQVELALFIASKIASALDYAHRKHDFEGKEMSLVHRDVSPQNVLVSQDGDIKLCDFGIAKAAFKASHTQAGALKGKLQYMSPEQAWGRSIDKRSDIFALATVLFEMLTGRKLFTGDNELSILEQVREARVVLPSEINDEVTSDIDQIVQKALEKDAAKRYQTAGEMARDLDAVLYSFKPTPTSADLAIYMHRIWSPEPVMPGLEPEPAPAPAPAPVKTPAPAPAPVAIAPAPAPVAAPVAQEALATPSFMAHEEEKKAPIVPIAIAAAVVILIGLGWFFMKGKSTPAGTPAASTAAPVASTAAPTTTTATTSAPTTTQAPTLDPSKVQAEVDRRLAADRLKLEQQAKAGAQPGAAPATTTQAPHPAPTTVAQAAPPPVTQTQAAAPAPAPVQPTPAPVQPPVTQTQAPAPAPAPAPAAAAVHEGDLVPAGTDGLVSAKMIRRGAVPYPPLAKLQKVEGIVILSALVSESGKVLEVRVLRPINRPVGLNEAAEEIVKRSTFSAPTKDGVKVKSWTTVPVEFKL